MTESNVTGGGPGEVFTVPGTATAELFDALPDNVAVVDRSGVIVAVNRAWRRFSLDNGGDDRRTGVGVDYLEVCRRAAASGCDEAEEAASQLRAALAGHPAGGDVEYPCDGPDGPRWYLARMAPMVGPGSALVMHTNITLRKMFEQEFERRASRDALTGLANRVLFTDRLTEALRPRRDRDQVTDVGLLYIDLDGFKLVNDVHGHLAGDEVLQTVARRLLAITRPTDTVARLGGDEFGLVVPRTDPAELWALERRVGAALDEPHLVHGRLVVVGASIGVHLAGPGHDITECIHRADASMYQAKRRRSRRV